MLWHFEVYKGQQRHRLELSLRRLLPSWCARDRRRTSAPSFRIAKLPSIQVWYVVQHEGHRLIHWLTSLGHPHTAAIIRVET